MRIASYNVENLFNRARALGLRRIFVLTFEEKFFARHGFAEITDARYPGERLICCRSPGPDRSAPTGSWSPGSARAGPCARWRSTSAEPGPCWRRSRRAGSSA